MHFKDSAHPRMKKELGYSNLTAPA